MALYRLLLLFMFFLPEWVLGQSLNIEVIYEPNTTYQWTRTSSYEASSEYIGTGEMIDNWSAAGIAAYNESNRERQITVTMVTGERKHDELPYCLTIDSLVDVHVSSYASHRNNTPSRLEIADLKVCGVINKFQRIEIDDIMGIDSLEEKNRVFGLLDNIHRSMKYPKHDFVIGESYTDTSAFQRSLNIIEADLLTTYTLDEIKGNLAHFNVVSKVIQHDEDNEMVDVKGQGSGKIIYDIERKMVTLDQHSFEGYRFNENTGLAIEQISKSLSNWTMNILNEFE